MEKILESLGLMGNEIKIYIKLLEIGPSLASKLAVKTELQRTYVYEILKRLVEKGLVSSIIRENRKYFQASNPEALEILFKQKEDFLKKERVELNKVITHLKKTSPLHEENLIASVYEGKKGFKTILEDILKTKEDYFVIGYTAQAEELLKYYLPNFHKRRIINNIKRKVIFSEKFKTNSQTKLKLQEIRFLPKGYPILSGTIIYSDKVVLVVIHEKQFVALLIKDKKISDSYRQQFNLLWKIAKK